MSTPLRECEFAWAAHLRDPRANPPPPGVEPRRLAIYRDLVLRNIEGLLAGNFPVIRRILDSERWQALVHDFIAEYRCQTPLFTEIAREFILYVEQRAAQARPDPEWLPELAHYEWIELDLLIADDAQPEHVANSDLLRGIPVVSPHVRLLAYRWPVQRLAPDFLPEAAPVAPTLLLARRASGGEVRFAELSPLAYRLLERLADNDGATGETLLLALAAEAGDPGTPEFIAAGTALLQRMRAEGTLLGTRPTIRGGT